MITQDNWPIALVSWDSLARNQLHHDRLKTLSQKSSAECCGDTNIRLYQPYIRYGQVDTHQSTPMDNTLKEYVLKIIYMYRYITQLQMQLWLIIQKSTGLLSTSILVCESMKEKASHKKD
jgi:hypothetical protein